MCGICGQVGHEDPALLDRMVETLGHRGPDDRGTFVETGVALGHTRLSIIDLDGGHQPMESRDGSLVIVFNGFDPWPATFSTAIPSSASARAGLFLGSSPQRSRVCRTPGKSFQLT